jgi:hypothetical protein
VAGVTVLRIAWPEVIDAGVVRALRGRQGEAPCPEGMREALRWIGKRRLGWREAIEDAMTKLDAGFVSWAMTALGIPGSGYGSGYGDGDGSGYGYGYGDGSGSGVGSGYGYGYGDGSGSGSGVGPS